MKTVQSKTKKELKSPATSQPTLYEKCFCDESGKLTLAQFPNMPIILAGCGWLLRIIFVQGAIARAGAVLFFGSIFWWCYLEISQGTNYFRRLLGLVVLVWIFLGLIRVNFQI